MVLGKKGETLGRVFNMGPAAPSTRIYFKPTVQKLIYRKANVNRQSDVVITVNKIFGDAKPSVACKGKKPWRTYVKCLHDTLTAQMEARKGEIAAAKVKAEAAKAKG